MVTSGKDSVITLIALLLGVGWPLILIILLLEAASSGEDRRDESL